VRRAGRPRGSTRDDRTSVTITCVVDGRAHRVSDLQWGAAEADGRGRYEALCGHVVTAGSLTEPDGAPCSACSTP